MGGLANPGAPKPHVLRLISVARRRIVPLQVVPFVIGMFALVEGLAMQGWVDALAGALGRASGAGGLGGTVWLMGVVSVLLANTINNQPMTILMTTVALNPRFVSAINEAYGGPPVASADQALPAAARTHEAALFALVVGSNVGALYTIIGALAGIMWANIVVRDMGAPVTYSAFARAMAPLGVVATGVTLLVLWALFAAATA